MENLNPMHVFRLPVYPEKSQLFHSNALMLAYTHNHDYHLVGWSIYTLHPFLLKVVVQVTLDPFDLLSQSRRINLNHPTDKF